MIGLDTTESEKPVEVSNVALKDDSSEEGGALEDSPNADK